MAKAILVADDSPDDIIFFTRVLGNARIQNPLFVVRDGAETIAYLKAEGVFADREKYLLPAILFLDLKMPRVHGKEVLHWLQQQPHLQEILVFVVSHFSDAKTFSEVYSLGAKSFLTKPVQPLDLQNLIQNFPGHWEQLAAPPPDAAGKSDLNP